MFSERQRCYSSTDSELELETTKLSLKSKDKNDICRKTLRLTSEQIVSMGIIMSSKYAYFLISFYYKICNY